MSAKVGHITWTILFLVLFTGPPKFRVRESDASLSGNLDMASLIQLVIWIIGAGFLIYQFSRSPKIIPIVKSRLQWFALAVIGVMFVSVFVSMSPSLSVFKAFQVLTAFCFSYAVIQRFGLEHFFRLVLAGSVILCLLVAILYFIDPSSVMELDSSGELRLRGRPIYEVCHPALFAIVTSLALPPKVDVKRVLIILFCGALLIASLTRIDWLALAVVLVLIVLLQPEIPGRTLVNYGLVLSPFLAVWALHILFRERELSSWYDLSERGGLWAYIILTTLATSPVWGNGFIAGSRVLGMDYMTTLASGHSLFVDMFAGCGLVGLIAFVVLWTIMARQVTRAMVLSRDSLSFLTGGLFWALMLIGFVGGDVEATPFGFLFWGLVAATIVRQPTVSIARVEDGWFSPRRVLVTCGIFSAIAICWMVYAAAS